jgi:flavin reductase (DIM6/NTAB) family NADH-FMN oxidoreductase RutF
MKTITSDLFRDGLRHFPAGVTVVTIKSADTVHGLTVSAFASVSPSTPLIMVAIDHRHTAHQVLEQPGASFAVNILAHDQAELSNRFAWMDHDERFDGLEWTTAATGAPVFPDVLAWLDCSIYASHKAGTHTIYIGLVEAAGVPRPDELPLVYWNRDYRQLHIPVTPGA